MFKVKVMVMVMVKAMVMVLFMVIVMVMGKDKFMVRVMEWLTMIPILYTGTMNSDSKSWLRSWRWSSSLSGSISLLWSRFYERSLVWSFSWRWSR